MSRFILLGVGAAGSARFAPAGLLLEYGHVRVGFDGGPGSEPAEIIDAWLVSDAGGPLQQERHRIARETGMPEPAVGPYEHPPLHIEPMPTAAAHGYRITIGHRFAVWAPAFAQFPEWAGGADLMFADGTGDRRRLAEVTAAAQQRLVRRLVLVPVGEVAIESVDGARPPPYGEWGEEGRAYRL